jgi:hypothetical protein
MNIDIIGSPFTKRLSEFKNFPFEINYTLEDQSLLSLFSSPYPATMEDLDTDDMIRLKNAYRELNRTHYDHFTPSSSNWLMIELSNELNDICEMEASYFNLSTIKLLKLQKDLMVLPMIERFRKLKSLLDRFASFASSYDKVILLKVLPDGNSHTEFLNAVYALLEKRLDNVLVLSIPSITMEQKAEKVPLEILDQLNNDLKKLNSKNYDDQLLFDERISDNFLSVFINHVEKRRYVYELYKDGQKLAASPAVDRRAYHFRLEQPGKYRIRVNILDSDVNARFTQTYSYEGADYQNGNFSYIELPRNNVTWQLEFLIGQHNIKGLVGNPYEYPEGYDGYTIYLQEEVPYQEILRADQIYERTFEELEELPQTKLAELAGTINQETASDRATKQYILHLITTKKEDGEQ